MNKLEVGMYVRTKYGINKIDKTFYTVSGVNHSYIELENCYIDDENDLRQGISVENIIKASFNIIDLIEVGDYVNNYRVIDSTEGLGILCITEDIKELNSCNIVGLLPFKFYSLKDMQIKSIVTKEMYSNVEYRVEAN